MTYVDSVSRRKVTMTDRRRDKQNSPLSACSRSAHERSVRRGAMIEEWESRGRETETVSLRSCNLSLPNVSFHHWKEMFEMNMT